MDGYVHGQAEKDDSRTIALATSSLAGANKAHALEPAIPDSFRISTYDTTAFRDEWPQLPDGSDYDGRRLLSLLESGNSPFREVWGVNLLVQEIEQALNTKVVDIPFIYHGSNNYGFHVKLSNRPDVIARIARGDVNMPGFDGFPIHVQIQEAKFEAAVYEVLRSEPAIVSSRLLYHRIPLKYVISGSAPPDNILGRRLMVFERARGENNVWNTLDWTQKSALLFNAAAIRGSLYNFELPLDFATEWLRERLFEQKPQSIPVPVSPTRDFCIFLLKSKIEATIKNIGDMIGWEDDNETVGPVAASAKLSLLRLIPHILPEEFGDKPLLYRLVLDHGDFGIHNMSITIDTDGIPGVTSLYDWETGCIIPALLSDPLMKVTVDLGTDGNAEPSVSRVSLSDTASDQLEYQKWSVVYNKALFDNVPEYEIAIKAGRDVRNLWFALRDWRGEDPEVYFGKLGAWAERILKEIGKP